MTYTIKSASGQLLAKKVEPWITESLEIYLQVVGQVYFDPIYEIAEETGTEGEAGWVPSYAAIFNPTTCPAKWLPWLAQFVGVEVPKVATEAEARKLIKEEAGLERGTLKTIEKVIERVTEVKTCRVEERTGEGSEERAYHFLVLVPSGKATTALREAIEEKKPGGVMFTITEASNAWIDGVKEKWTEISTTKWTELVEGDYLREEVPHAWEPWHGREREH